MTKTTPSIEQLLADLHHPTDFMARCDAARELGKTRDPRAVQALLSDLNDKDWRIRRNAAQALGVAKAKEAVDPLLAALKDRTSTVRCRAAVALGRIKDPRAIPPLIEMMWQDDSKAAWSAYDAVAKFGKTAIPLILERMKTADQRQQLTLLRLLGQIPKAGKAAIWLIEDLLKSPDPSLRIQAVDLLGKTGDPNAVDMLLTALGDSNPQVQSTAAKALGGYRDPRIIPALIDQLQDHDLYGEKRDLYQAITASMQQVSGMPKKFGMMFRNDPVWLAGLMGGSENPQVNDMIQRMNNMLDNFSGMLLSAEGRPTGAFDSLRGMVDRMGNSGEILRQEVEELIIMLSDPNPAMRIAATLCLPWYGNRRAMEPLRISCLDPDANARRAAVWAVDALDMFLQFREQI